MLYWDDDYDDDWYDYDYWNDGYDDDLIQCRGCGRWLYWDDLINGYCARCEAADEHDTFWP